MAISQKYGRTYHYPFSAGATSDDRIAHDYWDHLKDIPHYIHTEKLDGENNCLSKHGVFARSHAAPTTSPWTAKLRRYWQLIKSDLGNLEIFGENLYAIHSIAYRKLEHHFYVFGIREHENWLDWEETQFYAALLDLPTVPVLKSAVAAHESCALAAEILTLAKGRGSFEPYDVKTELPTTMEGIVTRNSGSYTTSAFSKNVFKYVRAGHVQTDQHWTRNWQRAALIQEGGSHVDH